MINWKEFFQNYRIVPIKNDADLLYQVGKSVAGKPISNEHFCAITESIIKELQLSDNDILLDLCCGNGVVTFELAKHVKEIIAVDVSESYIRNANKYKKQPNTLYFHGDVLDAAIIERAAAGRKFSKILLNEAIAYLTPADVENIMSYLNVLAAPNAKFMIGGILEKNKKWLFFDTFKRRLTYIVKFMILRKDMGLGRWWSRAEIQKIADKFGYSCRFVDHNPILSTAHYRFDVVLTKK